MTPQADTAIGILRALQKECGTEMVAYWVSPNVILTLSGARGYCDGVFWDTENKGLLEKWRTEIAATGSVIARHTSILWSDVSIQEAGNESYASYDYIFDFGLRYTLAQTRLVSTTLNDMVRCASLADFLNVLTADIRKHDDFQAFSAENLNHIAFGILLGYPDKAIVEAAAHWERQNKDEAHLIEADIRRADYYRCPQPVYMYPRQRMNDPDIVAHQALWSTILTEYYTSRFHKSLEADEAFQRKLRELGMAV